MRNDNRIFGDYMSLVSTHKSIHQYPILVTMRGWVYAVVLTLTLLNPLACLIHCDIQHQHHTIVGTAYVCDMGVTGMSAPPYEMQSTQSPTINAPQAYYAGVFMQIPVLLVILACIVFAHTVISPWYTHHTPPLTPPPLSKN